MKETTMNKIIIALMAIYFLGDPDLQYLSWLGDLKIYVWDSMADYSDADNDTVTLRFTFDPNTPLDLSDDMIDEVSFVLDNKPQAVCTRPYVIPARKTALLDASDSWVPGGIATIPADPNYYTWTFTSVPGGSALLDSDITNTTPGGQLLAYFQPDVPGDYVLSLEVDSGTMVSDTVVTTVHAVDPDNTTGTNGGANEAPVITNAVLEDLFGLAAGTLLTLVLVPVLYSLFFRVETPKSV